MCEGYNGGYGRCTKGAMEDMVSIQGVWQGYEGYMSGMVGVGESVR